MHRLSALVFTLAGLGLFAFLYFRISEGNVFAALSNPGTIILLFVPFLPAIFFLWRAGKAEAKLLEIVSKLPK